MAIEMMSSPTAGALSRLAGCAGLGLHYIPASRRAFLRRHKAEGQVGFTRVLGNIIYFSDLI